jgi:hypothetical protein
MDETITCQLGEEAHLTQLTWEAVFDPSGISQYEIYLEALEREPYVYPVQYATGTGRGVTLPCGEVYRWRVRAIDNAGNEGAWSEERDFFTQRADTTGPPPPNPLEPKQEAEIACADDPTNVLLRWDEPEDPSGIAGYFVQMEVIIYETPSEPTPTPVDLGPIATTSVEIPVDCGWDYQWRVRAVDGAGNVGDWSEWFYFYLPPKTLYDLYVRRMDFYPATPTYGELIELTIMIATDTRPDGAPYFPASYVRWRQGSAFGWQEFFCPEDVNYSSCTETVEFSYPSPGEYYVEVQADSRYEVTESNEDNNTSGWTITVETLE